MSIFQSELHKLQPQFRYMHLLYVVLQRTKIVPFRHPLLKLSKGRPFGAGPFFMPVPDSPKGRGPRIASLAAPFAANR